VTCVCLSNELYLKGFSVRAYGVGMNMIQSRRPGHGPSFLRWAGSKRKSLDRLGRAYRNSSHYIEPFAGSAALFFSVRPPSATLADLNGALINSLRSVRDNPEEVNAGLTRLNRSEESYYKYREVFNRGDSGELESAILFIYLNRNCFNGLWRTNKSGLFNVPYGGTEMGGNPPLSLLLECSQTLQTADLIHQDFRSTIQAASAGSFIYADPPYFSAAERTFIEYGAKSFGQEDLNELLELLISAHGRGVQVALTYDAATPLAKKLVGWHVETIEVIRNVGGFAGSRKKQGELLYTTPD
jgi:DNA adenine methylase